MVRKCRPVVADLPVVEGPTLAHCLCHV